MLSPVPRMPWACSVTHSRTPAHPATPILMLCKHVYGADAIALSWHSGRLLPIVLPPCGTETRCTSPQPSIAPHHTSILYRPAIYRSPMYRQPTDCPGIVSGVRRAAASPWPGPHGTPPDVIFPPPRWVRERWKANTPINVLET